MAEELDPPHSLPLQLLPTFPTPPAATVDFKGFSTKVSRRLTCKY